MFNDSYVFVVFEDGTDIYWARSRVVEYLQTIAGRLPANVHPAIGPDATGAGWVYEYVLVDHSHKQSLAELRSIQDWHLRYQLATVPGVAEVASIGGFVRQYQVQLDPNKLLAYGIPLSTWRANLYRPIRLLSWPFAQNQALRQRDFVHVYALVTLAS